MSDLSSRVNLPSQDQDHNKSFDPPEESPFTCPICLNWLRDPMLTSCGHRFCKTCIASWLNRDGACCPVDNIPIRRDNDLFPDNFTRREISQQRTKCPFASLGCDTELSPLEIDSHALSCQFRSEDVDLKTPFQCPYSHLGCNFIGNNLEDLKSHEEASIEQHLLLLSKAYCKMSVNITNSFVRSKSEESKMWDPPAKETEEGNKTEDKNSELIKAMYERIIILEQRTQEQDITINNLNKKIFELKSTQLQFSEEMLLRYCSGVYIWNITDFRAKLDEMKRDPTKTFYSKGFYTSPNGYRFCARLNLSPKIPGYIALLVHVMQTDHDACLDWPFSGRISLTIPHPLHFECSIKETMMSRPDLEAFRRPNKKMNPLGFGYTEFILIEELLDKDYLDGNKLTVKIQVQPV